MVGESEDGFITDRFNTLITTKPFSSINLTSRQTRLKTNLQAKTLMSMGKKHQHINSDTVGIVMLPANKYSICNRLKTVVNTHKPSLTNIFGNNPPNSGSNSLRTTHSFNYRSENISKGNILFL